MQSREGVSFMEIERKYLLDQLPENLTSYPCKKIEQGYLSTEPVVRIRRSDDEYYLTYKSKGLMVREEYNLPLTKESYLHLREKADGVLISKTRYLLPLTGTDLTKKTINYQKKSRCLFHGCRDFSARLFFYSFLCLLFACFGLFFCAYILCFCCFHISVILSKRRCCSF